MLVSAFNPGMAGDVEPFTRRIVRATLDKVARELETGPCDVVRTATIPIPSAVTVHILGFPEADADQVGAWGAEIMDSDWVLFNRNERGVGFDGFSEFRDYINEHVATRRAESDPPDDLVTRLIQAEFEGEHLNDTQIRTVIAFLFLAGVSTTTALMGNLLYQMLADRPLFEQVRADPSLAPTAVEESLRYTSPVTFMARTAATDTAAGRHAGVCGRTDHYRDLLGRARSGCRWPRRRGVPTGSGGPAPALCLRVRGPLLPGTRPRAHGGLCLLAGGGSSVPAAGVGAGLRLREIACAVRMGARAVAGQPRIGHPTGGLGLGARAQPDRDCRGTRMSTSESVDTDVVVVGSGGAALTAALAARINGARVTVIEKSDVIGGTTAMSGGLLWVPNNRHMRDEGYDDSFDDALRYLRRLANGRRHDDDVRTVVEAGPAMVDFLEAAGEIRFETLDKPDYHPEFDGAKDRGRCLAPLPLVGSTLGPWFERLRPVSGFGVPLSWRELDAMNGVFHPERLDLAVMTERAEAGFVGMGRALVGWLLKANVDAGVDIRVSTRAYSLRLDGPRVVGVDANGPTGLLSPCGRPRGPSWPPAASNGTRS